METVSVNDFVRRQIKGSGKTYSDTLTFEDMANHAQVRMSEGYFKEGYRDGVRIVQASSKISGQFICPLIKIDDNTQLAAEVVTRRKGEEPYIRVRAVEGSPLPASKLELILYRHDVLVENSEQSSNADWELISINAVPKDVDHLPMKPVTMMRNQLELPGGTAAHYSSQEWAESVRFWQHYTAIE